jgi:hypothetical protein
VIKNKLKFLYYKECLFKHQNHHEKQNGFRTKGHKMFTNTVNKVALSFADDKSYIDDNNITTKTIGHYKISNNI